MTVLNLRLPCAAPAAAVWAALGDFGGFLDWCENLECGIDLLESLYQVPE